MLKNYLKIAFRNLFHNKIFTTINTVGLAIGMAATLLIFVWVQNELTFDNYHKDADRIYRMITHLDVGKDVWNWGSVPYMLTEVAPEEIPEIEEIAKVRHIFGKPVFKTKDGSLFTEKEFAYVDKKWLDLFDYQIVKGSLKSFQNNIYSIALTETKAKQFFGELPPLGQTLSMDSTTYTVDLILKDNPTNSVLQFKGFIPIKARFAKEEDKRNDRSWGNFDYQTFIKSKAGVSPKVIEEKLLVLLDKYRTDKEKNRKNDTSISLEAIQDIRFSEVVDNDQYKHQNKSAVYLFALIGLMLMMSASFNYVNLSTALINKRVKEIGVKKIVGATFGHIFFQVITETILISALSLFFAIGLAQFALPFLQEVTDLPLALAISSLQLWIVLAIMLGLNVLIAGIYPAILFAGFKPIKLIKGKLLTPQGLSLRKGLVVSQFVVAIAMLISTVIAYQQLQFIHQKNVGYDRSYVLEISPNLFNGDWKNNFKKFDVFAQELRRVPEFEAIAQSSGSLVDIRSASGGNFKWAGLGEDEKASVNTLDADEALLLVYDLEMAEGRWFKNELETDKKNYIINEAAAKKFDLPQPIVNAQVTNRGEEGQIIGIVKDFHFKSMHHAITPLLISHNSGWSSTISAKVNGKTGQQALKKAEKKFATHFPNLPFEYTFLDDTFEKMHETEAKMTLLLQIFAFLLIIISCLGLFGLATFAVERRTKEIGIRKVLGANTRLIVQLLSKDFLKLVSVALVIAIPLAYYGMQTWLNDYAYRVEMQWWMFALTGLATIGIAFITVSIQSVKAALQNPAEVLKSE